MDGFELVAGTVQAPVYLDLTIFCQTVNYPIVLQYFTNLT